MSSHFAKPENALRKAKDLVTAGKESSALRTLHAILTSKRYRTWQATHEKIMQRYIELAIDLRRPVKDALIQYRSICHQQNISSLEKMIRKYRRMAEDRAKKAEDDGESKNIKEKTSLLEGRDVELDDTPESILQQAITGEDKGDRAGRQSLLPWVKYLWDTYRTILEVIRNNARLEPLYHATVRQAFDFCRHYRRNVEFRHLCDILRQHLTGISKHQLQTNAVDLQAGETQRLYLETRFEQLRVASELELWQEAYRTIEDIHENMRLSTTTPKPALMTVYYDKLSRIFWASDNHLFHAYSLSKYFTLAATIKGQEAVVEEKEVKTDKKPQKDADDEDVKNVDVARKLPEAKELTADERRRWATSVVLATLVIPAGERFEHEGLPSAENEGNLRLANLLGFKKETPTRARLLQNVAASILGEASVEAQKTYELLETKFGPLSLNAQIEPLLAGFEKDELLSKYVPALKNLTVVRLLKQLSSVYKTMRMDKFLALAPKITNGAMERLVMAAVRSDQLQLRWDHRAQLLHFTEEGMESQRVKEQLFVLAQRLQKVVEKIAPASSDAKSAERRHVYGRVRQGVDAEHKEVFIRRMEIENRKREAERLQDEKEKAEQLAKIREANEKKAEEKKRLEAEQKRRADDRIKAEREQHEMEQKKKLAEDLARFANKGVANTRQGKQAAELTANLAAVKKEQLALAQAQLIEAEKKEAEKKRRERARQHDYLIRAVRLEEKELLVKAREHQLKADAEAIEIDFKKFEEQHKVAHSRAMHEKERLARMTKHKQIFFQQIIDRRSRELEEEMAARAKVEKQKNEERAAAESRRRAEDEARQRESDEKLRKEQAEAKATSDRESAQRQSDERRPAPVASRIGATGIAKPLDTRGSAIGGPRRGLQATVARGDTASAASAAPPAAAARGESYADTQSTEGGEAGPWRRGGAAVADSRPAAAPVSQQGNADAGPWRRGGPPAAAAQPAGPPPSDSNRWRRDGPSPSAAAAAPVQGEVTQGGGWRPKREAAPAAAGDAAVAPAAGGSDRFGRASVGASQAADGARDWRGSSAGPFASQGAGARLVSEGSRFDRRDDRRDDRPSGGFGGRGFGRRDDAPPRAEGNWERRGPPAAGGDAAAAPVVDDGFRPAGGARGASRGFGGGRGRQ